MTPSFVGYVGMPVRTSRNGLYLHFRDRRTESIFDTIANY